MIRQGLFRNLLGSLIAISLLGLYLSADLVGSLHSFFVHEEPTEVVCTLENEKDACHRTIYHHDTKTGCEHPTHLTKPIKSCELCSILLTHHVMPAKKTLKGVSIIQVPVIPVLEARLVLNPACAAHGLRGPPSFS